MKTETERQPLRAVAQVRKSFGVRGEVKIESYSRSLEEIAALQKVLVGLREQDASFREIESAKERGGDIYLKFRGVDDKTASDLLRGHFLFVEESRRKTLPKERFYIDELIGCAVKTEQGTLLGTIGSVDAYPAQMVYSVRTKQGMVLLPAVREFIVSVDVEAKVIVVRPPEGLFGGEML